jgi:hypothetical protein
MIGLQLVYTYAPFMNALFGSAPITGTQWAQVVALALVSFVIVELEKLWRARSAARRPGARAAPHARTGTSVGVGQN